MRYCGRTFTAAEIALIRELLAVQPPLDRARLSREVCARLPWRRPDGRLKDMSCRVEMLKMQADGLFTLPPPRTTKPPVYRAHPDIERAVQPPPIVPHVDLAELRLEPVSSRAESLLWNTYIQLHHYLGYQLLPGAQLRYFARSAEHTVALLGFGASAWKTRPRDALIGWTAAQRARLLILPWIQCKNLASRVLALAARRLADDWQQRYAYRPVLMETFVEKPRFTGHCYRAANWQYLGDTQGRGKLDTFHHRSKPVKSVWIYPLARNYRRQLCSV